jgi:hypothetical protein
VGYLASNAKLLGIVKRKRKPGSDPPPWVHLTEAARA